MSETSEQVQQYDTAARRAEIEAVFDTYSAAVEARDVAGLLAIYDDDVHRFDVWNDWEFRGIALWREMVDPWLASHLDERLTVAFHDLEVLVSGDVALAHAVGDIGWFNAAGERMRGFIHRFTFGLERRDGIWRIVHEHASMPIDHETMLAIEER